MLQIICDFNRKWKERLRNNIFKYKLVISNIVDIKLVDIQNMNLLIIKLQDIEEPNYGLENFLW